MTNALNDALNDAMFDVDDAPGVSNTISALRDLLTMIQTIYQSDNDCVSVCDDDDAIANTSSTYNDASRQFYHINNNTTLNGLSSAVRNYITALEFAVAKQS